MFTCNFEMWPVCAYIHALTSLFTPIYIILKHDSCIYIHTHNLFLHVCTILKHDRVCLVTFLHTHTHTIYLHNVKDTVLVFFFLHALLRCGARVCLHSLTHFTLYTPIHKNTLRRRRRRRRCGGSGYLHYSPLFTFPSRLSVYAPLSYRERERGREAGGGGRWMNNYSLIKQDVCGV